MKTVGEYAKALRAAGLDAVLDELGYSVQERKTRMHALEAKHRQFTKELVEREFAEIAAAASSDGLLDQVLDELYDQYYWEYLYC